MSQDLNENKRRGAVRSRATAGIFFSTPGRLSAAVEFFGRQVTRIIILVRAIRHELATSHGVPGLGKQLWTKYRKTGLKGLKNRLILASSQFRMNLTRRKDYAEWIRRYDTLTDEIREKMRVKQERFVAKPLISVIMPTFNSNPEWLAAAIDSVLRQIYPHWELCIADDASSDPAVRRILDGYMTKDQRIKVRYRDNNGHISAASNSALERATGQWIALLDHDDLLAEHALFWVAETINTHPNVGLIYSDEDRVTASGVRFAPYFKSDWNPDLFYSHNLITHLGVYRADIVEKVGGFREGFEGAQDYDLALRCIEHLQASQVLHIPRVLYHWRAHARSTAMTSEAKPYAMLAGERAINEHFTRTNIHGRATYRDIGYQVSYELPNRHPLVTIIIPTRNGKLLLEQCVESILDKTAYKNYEILIVDNGSDESASCAYLRELSRREGIQIIREEGPFNYAYLNNKAVSMAKGEIVALLNNDLEVISPDWLNVMVSHALRPGIAAVGAKLWYENKTIQHGGIILGIGGLAGHSHRHFRWGSLGYSGRLVLTQNFSAVTGACLVIQKEIFNELGGLDQDNLAVALNDVDFCLRAVEAGYRNVWTPDAELFHHESATRGYENTAEKQARADREKQYMKDRWGAGLLNDPAYSPNLTLDFEDFSYAWPPRVAPI